MDTLMMVLEAQAIVALAAIALIVVGAPLYFARQWVRRAWRTLRDLYRHRQLRRTALKRLRGWVVV